MKRNSWYIIGTILVLVIIIAISINSGRREQRDIVYGLFPLTGNVGIVGEYLKNGLTLGCDAGGEGFVVLTDDSKADPKTAHAAMQKTLFVNKPKIVLTAISGVALAIRDMLETEKVLHFSMVGTDQLLTENSKYTYRFYPSSSYIADFISSWIEHNKQERGIHKISIVYQNNEWGNSYCEAMKQKFIKSETFSVDENRDEYINIAARINTTGSDCLCVSLLGDSCAEFIKRIRLAGYRGLIICDNNFTAAVAAKCSEHLDNMVVVDFAKPNGSEFDAFQKTYVEKFGGIPDMPAILTYEVMQIFSRAIAQYGDDAWNDNVRMQGFIYDGMLGRITVEGREIRFPLVVKDAIDVLSN